MTPDYNIPLQTQLAYMMHELGGSEKATANAFASGQYVTPQDYATAFENKYERAGGSKIDMRQQYALEVFNAMKSPELAAGLPQNARTSYEYFIKQGMSPQQSAGIVGNLMVESFNKVDPQAFNPAGGNMGAYGVAQWRGPRQQGLLDFAKTRPQPLAAPGVRNALNMQPQQNTNRKVQPMQQRPQNQQNGLLGFFKNQNPSTGLTKAQQFAAALDPLIMPSMRSGEGIRAQGQQRVQENARSSSMEYLRKAASGGDKNAQLYLNAIESRSITPSEGVKGYVSSMATNAQNKVRANKIYSNGLVVQATDQGTVITAPNGQRLTGQAAQDALKAANNYEVELSRAEAGATAIGKISAEQSRDALQKIELTKKSITNIDMAIKAIDDGAKSGIIYNMLPNVTLASGQLATAMNNMGLDVIQSVTFGALSEGEMRLAMETAVPRNLPPNELRQYLVDKKAAQQKAVDALYQAAISLSDPNFDFNAHIKKKAAENTANIKVWNPNANNGAGGFE
jgi:hypothetical protein